MTRPKLVSSPLLKEQNFGVAEGQKWTQQREPGLTNEEHWARGIFPVLDGRKEKFPEGESRDDLRDRAERAIKELVVPTIKNAMKEKKEEVHVALVSHKACIGELIAALVGLDHERKSKGLEVPDKHYVGVLNAAWARVTVDLTVRFLLMGQIGIIHGN